MKAALLESAPGELVIVDDVHLDAVGPREILIQTAAAGVCHSDLHYMQGKYRTRHAHRRRTRGRRGRARGGS